MLSVVHGFVPVFCNVTAMLKFSRVVTSSGAWIATQIAAL